VAEAEGATKMTRSSLIRVGNAVINLDNVIYIDLDWEDDDGESCVVFEFLMRGADELEDGESIVAPLTRIFGGEEAEALREYLQETVPDLLSKRKE
jgi:hypothetical protein